METLEKPSGEKVIKLTGNQLTLGWIAVGSGSNGNHSPEGRYAKNLSREMLNAPEEGFTIEGQDISLLVARLREGLDAPEPTFYSQFQVDSYEKYQKACKDLLTEIEEAGLA